MEVAREGGGGARCRRGGLPALCEPGFLRSYIAFELRTRCRRGGLPAQRGLGFWRSYIAFELDHGSTATPGARAVAEAACPRDAAVHAKYAKAELRLGDDDRAPAMRASAQEWLVDEVRRYGDSISERGHEQLEDKSL